MPPSQKRRRASVANNDDGDDDNHSNSDTEDTNAAAAANKRRKHTHTHTHARRAPLFSTLSPRIRHVSQQTVKTKWNTLPEPMQERVLEMFRGVERSVIMRQGRGRGQKEERKRVEVQGVVGTVVRNLSKRLPRMPFPPVSARDVSFDYEGALGEQRALGTQLSTVTNSVDLLKAEVAREEKELAREKALLEEMERNAKMAESARKRQVKNDHPMLRRLEQTSFQQQEKDGSASFDIRDMKTSDVGLSDIGDDPDLLPLMKQLRNHLESMQSNALQTSGIRDAILQSQAALDLVRR